MVGKWVQTEGTAAELYEGQFVGSLEKSLDRNYCSRNILSKVSRKNWNNVHIALDYGNFQAHHPFGCAYDLVFENDLNYGSMRMVYKNFLNSLSNLPNFHVKKGLRIKKISCDGTEFYERIEPIDSKGSYKIFVEFPENLMLGNEKYDKKLVLKSKKIGLEEAQKRRESLMSICETAEREGFNVDVKSYFSDEKKMGFDGGCVCPKFAGLDESIKHLMMGQQVEFVVKSNQGGSGHVLDSVVDSTCQFGHSPSIRLKFSAGDEYPEYRKNLISNLREIIGATGAKIEPDNIISLSEYVGTPISEYVAANLSQLLAPIGNGLHYASHKGDDFVTAIKNGLINIDKKIDPDKYRIKDVLKEGHAHGGDHCSCVYIMNSENTKSEE